MYNRKTKNISLARARAIVAITAGALLFGLFKAKDFSTPQDAHSSQTKQAKSQLVGQKGLRQDKENSESAQSAAKLSEPRTDPVTNSSKPAINDPQEKPQDYIAACENIPAPGLLSEEQSNDPATQQLLENTELFISELAIIDSVDAQIAHALISSNSKEISSLEALQAIYQQYPENKLLHYDLASSCAAKPESCDDSFFQRAIIVDGENGALWLSVAINAIAKNNQTEAINALNQMAASPIYNEYLGEHIVLFENALMMAGANAGVLSEAGALGLASVIPQPSLSSLFRFCQEASEQNQEIAFACLNAGQVMADSSRTMLSQSVGMALQKGVYQRQGDVAGDARVDEKKAAFDKQLNLYNQASQLKLHKRQLAKDWYEQLKSSGEGSAKSYLIEEAIRLSAEPDFDPCENEW